MAEKKRRPTAPTIPGNPLTALVKARLRALRGPLTTIRTQSDMAALMGVELSTLKTYLNGRRRATEAICDRMAEVLGMATAEVQQAADATWAARPGVDDPEKASDSGEV